MKTKTTVDTPYKNSWAHQELTRPKVDRLSQDFGKPAILIPGFEKSVSLGPIDHKHARTFNG